MLVTGSAWAEWVLVAEGNTSSFYLNSRIIRKDSNLRKVWVAVILNELGKSGEWSWRVRDEFDYKDERHKILGFSSHSEPMAGGTVLLTVVEDDVMRATPLGTDAATTLNIVCAK